jgi:hypothetical protein
MDSWKGKVARDAYVSSKKSPRGLITVNTKRNTTDCNLISSTRHSKAPLQFAPVTTAAARAGVVLPLVASIILEILAIQLLHTSPTV